MIKRTVTFDIATDGSVMPSVPLYGGVKGEHNATKVVIRLSEGLYGANDAARLSFTTGDGTILSSDLLDVTALGTHIEYELPQLLTIAAGQLCMRLVISHIVDGEETETWRSSEMVLYFEEAGVENGTPFWTGVSQMLARTATASGAAVDAQAAAESAKNDAGAFAEQAENAKIAAVEAEEAAQQAAASAWEAVDTPGRQGASAYEVAVANGFEGSEEEWLASLKGTVDEKRLSELEVQVDANNEAIDQLRFDVDANTGAQAADSVAIKQLLEDVETNSTDISNNTSRITNLKSAIGPEIADIRGRLDTIEAEDTLRYKGAAYSSQLGMITDQQVGDVWFNTTDSRFYVWDGVMWRPFAHYDTTITADGTNPVTGGAVHSFVNDMISGTVMIDGGVGVLMPTGLAVSGAAVYRFVNEQITAYDTDVMTVLGVDEE